MMYGKYQEGKSCWKSGACWRFVSTLLLVTAGVAALVALYDVHEKLQIANIKALEAADAQNNLVTQLQIETEEKKKISETWQKQKREWEAERETITNNFADERQEFDQKLQDADNEIVAAKEEMGKLREDLDTLKSRAAAEPKPEVTTLQIKAELSVAANDTTVSVTSEKLQAS